MRVVAITSGRDVPSSRFRVRQHLPSLESAGIVVREFAPAIDKYAALPARLSRFQSTAIPWAAVRAFAGLKLFARLPGIAASHTADAVWLERELIPGRFTLERYIGRPIVFDVDDAIWLSGPAAENAARRIAERSEIVIAGNEFIADKFSRWSDSVRVIPTAVDCERFHPRALQSSNDKFVVGWTGTSSNFHYLQLVEAPLAAFLQGREAELLIVADRPPVFNLIPPDKVTFVRWSGESEAEIVRRMDVGIMPLDDSEWSRGKCAFKMLQYLASGIPVVVSPYGMNREVLDLGAVGFGPKSEADWLAALEAAQTRTELRAAAAVSNTLLARSRFSVETVSAQIVDVFQSLNAGNCRV